MKVSKNMEQNYKIFCKSIKEIPFEDFEKRFNNTKFYLIGDKGLVTITDRNEIGYGIIPEHRRKGLARNAIKELMKVEPRKYYWALIDKDNEVSMRFIQSMNFVPRGISYGFNTAE